MKIRLVVAALLLASLPALAARKSKKHAPVADPKHPTLVISTTAGDIPIELDAAKAPATVENFLQYVKDGFYEGTIFHRTVPGFVIQGGGYDKDGKEKPTRASIRNESDNGLSNQAGTLAMARTMDPNSAKAQFYVNLRDNGASLDGAPGRAGYAVFGRVTGKGMEVVNRIAQGKARTFMAPNGMAMQNWPEAPVVITAVKAK